MPCCKQGRFGWALLNVLINLLVRLPRRRWHSLFFRRSGALSAKPTEGRVLKSCCRTCRRAVTLQRKGLWHQPLAISESYALTFSQSFLKTIGLIAEKAYEHVLLPSSGVSIETESFDSLKPLNVTFNLVTSKLPLHEIDTNAVSDTSTTIVMHFVQSNFLCEK